MATKPEAVKPEEEEPVKSPAKNKKLLIIIIAAVLILALVGAGVLFYLSRQHAAAAAEGADGEATPPAAQVGPKSPPAYLPLDNMVVNLADPGGEKVAQIGITLEVVDAHAADTVKAFLPTIRSAILLLISQRTAEELLSQEGKQKLASDILHEASIPFGGGESAKTKAGTAKKKSGKAAAHPEYPVVGVLFSSFIVQ